MNDLLLDIELKKVRIERAIARKTLRQFCLHLLKSLGDTTPAQGQKV